MVGMYHVSAPLNVTTGSAQRDYYYQANFYPVILSGTEICYCYTL